MKRKLSKVDDLIRSDHSYLTDEDECFFIGEYTARKGYQYSETNQLIFNLKKSPKLQGTPQFRYKNKAIAEAATLLRETIGAGSIRDWLENATLVPIPPSKTVHHVLYDDRLLKILRKLSSSLGIALDIRELIFQVNDMDAAHESAARPAPQMLRENYRIRETLVSPEPVSIGLFDDLLTAGSHFRAAKDLLGEQFPGVPIVGIFLARRVPSAEDFGFLQE